MPSSSASPRGRKGSFSKGKRVSGRRVSGGRGSCVPELAAFVSSRPVRGERRFSLRSQRSRTSSGMSSRGRSPSFPHRSVEPLRSRSCSRRHVHCSRGDPREGRRRGQPHAHPDHDLRLPEREDPAARRLLRADAAEIAHWRGIGQVTPVPRPRTPRRPRLRVGRSRAPARGLHAGCDRRSPRAGTRERTG
jgi:hypothetical protein